MSVPQASSGMNMLVLSVPMAGPGILTLSLVSVQLPQLGTVSLVSYVPVVEYTATSPTNANAPAAKPSMDSSALSTVPLASSITKPLGDVPAPADNSGMETSVSSVTVDKLGMPPSTPVSAPLVQFGMDTHALIHAQVEESSTLLADNVSALLVTGTVLPASSVLTLKFGQPQD